MLKQKLQQKLLQKLSPQQIQMIKLLEIPTMQLEQRIKKELEENPILEEGEETEEEQVRDEAGEPEPETEGDGEEVNEEEGSREQNEFSLEDYIEDDEIPTYKLNSSNYSKDDKYEEIPVLGGIFLPGAPRIAAGPSYPHRTRRDDRLIPHREY